MNITLMFFLILSGANQMPLQSAKPNVNTEAEVEKLVIQFFDAMRNSNSERMETYLSADATLNTVAQSDQDSTILRPTDIRAFLNSVENTEAGTLDEQLTSFEAHVDGNLATTWMDYRFYAGGEFSHCGVNTMNLIKMGDNWKIFSIVDTRRTEGC